jgi:hypothetical protein
VDSTVVLLHVHRSGDCGSGTDNTIGDDPLDALATAIAEVVAQYRRAFNRRPSKEEWESLLDSALGGSTSDEPVVDGGAVTKVRIEVDGTSL